MKLKLLNRIKYLAVVFSGQVTLTCVTDRLNRCVTSFLPSVASLTALFFIFPPNFDTQMNFSEFYLENSQRDE